MVNGLIEDCRHLKDVVNKGLAIVVRRVEEVEYLADRLPKFLVVCDEREFAAMKPIKNQTIVTDYQRKKENQQRLSKPCVITTESGLYALRPADFGKLIFCSDVQIPISMPDAWNEFGLSKCGPLWVFDVAKSKPSSRRNLALRRRQYHKRNWIYLREDYDLVAARRLKNRILDKDFRNPDDLLSQAVSTRTQTRLRRQSPRRPLGQAGADAAVRLIPRSISYGAAPRVLKGVKLNESLTSILTDPEMLILAFDDLRQRVRSPGLDGVSARDLSASEIAEVMGDIAVLIKDGRYRPQPTRHVSIPKSSGQTRSLSIRSVIDAAVAKLILTLIAPAVESRLSNEFHGFRHGRSTFSAIRRIERARKKGNSWVILADVERAFDVVPTELALKSLLAMFRAGVKANSIYSKLSLADRKSDYEFLESLLGRLLEGNDNTRSISIDQGDSLSPIAFNCIMHKLLKLPL